MERDKGTICIMVFVGKTRHAITNLREFNFGLSSHFTKRVSRKKTSFSRTVLSGERIKTETCCQAEAAYNLYSARQRLRRVNDEAGNEVVLGLTVTAAVVRRVMQILTNRYGYCIDVLQRFSQNIHSHLETT